MIRAAIVGLGRWGKALVNAATGQAKSGSPSDLHFVVGMTRTRASAEAFCREKAITLVDSYDEILRDPDVDAVVLATPHSQHQAQALAAIAARKHVFVEKPLTLDLKSARAVADAAERAGLILAVGFTRRFHPSIGELRARMADGRLGGVMALVAQHTTSTAQFIAPGNWRAAPEEAPGGAFTAVGMHALDHMIEFAGRVRDVRAITARNYPGSSDDTTTALLRFVGGATGSIFCSVATATNFSFAAYGTNGIGEITRADLSQFRFTPASTAAPAGLVTAPPDEVLEFSGFDMLHAQMNAFARTIRDGNSYQVPIADVLHGMAVFDALVESARHGGDVIAVNE